MFDFTMTCSLIADKFNFFVIHNLFFISKYNCQYVIRVVRLSDSKRQQFKQFKTRFLISHLLNGLLFLFIYHINALSLNG